MGLISIAILPMWNGEINIYDPNTTEIKLLIRIKNDSKSMLQVNEVYLSLKNAFFLFSPENQLISSEKKLIASGESFEFNYSIEHILSIYGDRKKIYFKLISDNKTIQSRSVSIKELNDFIVTLSSLDF